MSLQTKHLLRHYAEMVVAMFLGMAILGLPAGWILDAAGAPSGSTDAGNAVMFLSMATTMTAGMVGWMVYRGHGARANVEMAATMYVPAFGAIALLLAGAGSAGALMVAMHLAMLAAMAGVMVARPHEYACHHRREAMPVTA